MGKGGRSSLSEGASVSLGVSLNHSTPVRAWAPQPCEGGLDSLHNPVGVGDPLRGCGAASAA